VSLYTYDDIQKQISDTNFPRKAPRQDTAGGLTKLNTGCANETQEKYQDTVESPKRRAGTVFSHAQSEMQSAQETSNARVKRACEAEFEELSLSQVSKTQAECTGSAPSVSCEQLCADTWELLAWRATRNHVLNHVDGLLSTESELPRLLVRKSVRIPGQCAFF
jgi:hypothetical protein